MMRAEDCRPLNPQPDAAQRVWLGKLAREVTAGDLVVSFSGDGPRNDDEPVVYCDWDGTWWAGRYVGAVTYNGHTLTITPRFGLPTLSHWLSLATSVLLTDSPGRLNDDESFIAELLASVWASALVKAARHGLPSLRHAHTHQGQTIRGRLDVPATVRLRTSRRSATASVDIRKTLAHDASAAIVAAHSVLSQALKRRGWEPDRVTELMPALRAAVGSRPALPSPHDLRRVRYTPITAGFAPVADLSLNIARRRGLFADIDNDGQTRGVLLDVAELWELYVLNVTRSAFPETAVTHGTRTDSPRQHLLESSVTEDVLGTLIPDVFINGPDGATAVIDAKYKSLHPTKRAPRGPQADDLYQMTAYLGRFTHERTGWGLLAYPEDPLEPLTPAAQTGSPWRLADRRSLSFIRLPHDHARAVQTLKGATPQRERPEGRGEIPGGY